MIRLHEIGAAVRARRQAVGLSLQQLAAFSGIGGTRLIAMHWSVRAQANFFTPLDGVA